MRFPVWIDAYVRDQRQEGRINSDRTERDYRAVLMRHSDDVDSRDPRYTSREDVKRTLAHWTHPNTRSKSHAILRAFYEWMVEEGERPANPARQVRRTRRRKPSIYRLTRAEAVALLEAVRGTRERRLIYLGLCAGLRAQELRGLQGRHFRRQRGGLWVWVSPDIGKGKRERWVPVLPDLAPVWQEIAQSVADEEYVFPAQRWRDPGRNRMRSELLRTPSSPQAIWRAVKRVGVRAGIAAEIGPHTLRHAFADTVARRLSVDIAKAMLGHADLSTTEEYLNDPSLDDLAQAIARLTSEQTFGGAKAAEAPTGIEPVASFSRALERLFSSPVFREAARSMR